MTKFFSILVLLLFFSENLLGTFSLEDLHSDSTYPIESSDVLIFPEYDLLRHRVLSKRENVEPLSFTCRKDGDRCVKLISSFAQEGQEEGLKKTVHLSSQVREEGWQKIEFTHESFPFLNFDKIQKALSSSHSLLQVKTRGWKKETEESFFGELVHFFPSEELLRLREKSRQQGFLSFTEDLLPSSVKKRVGRFTGFRGPNCFEAALAFQNSEFSKSYQYNVKNEPHHHKLMINNDELVEVLENHFVELDPQTSPLRYGDVLIFVDYGDALSERDFHYSWVKHASVFLVNGFTFSKGSKSANSPYTIKKLSKEWHQWSKRYNFLKIKAFRKPVRENTAFNQKKLVDWIY